MKYVMITPVYNEEKNIEITIKSVLQQTLLPQRWIIVDDNSSDSTYQIVDSYRKNYEWITLIKAPRNHGQKGQFKGLHARAITPFNFAYQFLDESFDFIVKLDGDLDLPSNYFCKISDTFIKYPDVGICGGYCVFYRDGKEYKEKSASYHVRGAFKSIRMECWEVIGGFVDIIGFDGLDEMTAMYKGWKTLNLEIPVIHLKPTMQTYKGLKFAFKRGRAVYKNGSNIFLAIVRFAVNIVEKPYFLFALAMLFGYCFAFINQEDKMVSRGLAKFINNFHMNRLIKLKRY